jgi:hypothetical protein
LIYFDARMSSLAYTAISACLVCGLHDAACVVLKKGEKW